MTTQNRLLSAMPPALLEKLAPHLKRVELERGDRLHAPGEVIVELYFPVDCILSITITMQNGSTAETGLAGRRDMLGVNAIMGDRETTQTSYIVQTSGSAIKIDAQVLRNEFNCDQDLRDIMLRYVQAFIAQVSQATACNSLHRLELRLARWLLEMHDRVEGNELSLTQEFISQMLGVRRAGVTQVAQELQEEGLIRYHRGHVQILNQEGLEAYACECFQVVKDEYDRLLGTTDGLLP